MWKVDNRFIHGCLFCCWMCRSDVSVIPLRMCPFFFSSQGFWPCRFGFLNFPCLWEISFSGQMMNGTVSSLLGLDRIFRSGLIFK